ncbi:MAG TPA: hypothetical protein VH257_07705, partial [Chloroflexota bacterium]|nr:hypothetical protein [Chloroflexota bacterium]
PDRHLAGARQRLGPARAARLQAAGGQDGAVESRTLALEALTSAALTSEEAPDGVGLAQRSRSRAG